jgi:1-acyl-sn-glycerol-3-phosphate acyltransferase
MKNYNQNVRNVIKEVHNFFYTTYSNIHISGPKIDPNQLKNCGLMIVCTHRSMADYYLLGMIMNEMGIENLRFAAGDNLTRLPVLGKKFKAFGAFDVERDSALRRSYIKRLREQVVSMMEDNDSIIVFPEGGRSYHGEMLEFKGGVLSAAVVAQARNPAKKIMVLPISLSYERIYELPYFSILQKGKAYRKPGSNFFKRKLGDIYYFGADIFAFLNLYFNYKLHKKQGDIFIDYLKPVAVNDIVDINANFDPSASDDLFCHKQSIKIMGETLHKKLVEIYRLLPVHIVAHLIKAQPQMIINDLQQRVLQIKERLANQKRNILSIENLSGGEIIETGIKQLTFYNAITINDKSIKITKPAIVDYFAAAI